MDRYADPQLFYSFGPWHNLDDVREMRSHPRTAEVMEKMRDLCEEIGQETFGWCCLVRRTRSAEADFRESSLSEGEGIEIKITHLRDAGSLA